MADRPILERSDAPPCDYDRAPEFEGMIAERDSVVVTRDGKKLMADVYRPQAEGRFPALLAFAIYNKDLQGPDYARSLPPQPSWAPLWAGLLEAGDTRFFVSRGYVHVIGSPRGIGGSDGGGSLSLSHGHCSLSAAGSASGFDTEPPEAVSLRLAS